MLEKTLESPLDSKEIQPALPKGNQSWIFIGRTDVEAETPILWPPDAKSWLIWKDPDSGKDWRQEENRKIEDEMVGWPHQHNRHEFEQAPGVDYGWESLVCCSLWGRKVGHNWAAELNWTFKKLCTVKFTFFLLYSSVELEKYMEIYNSLQSRCRAALLPLPQIPRCSHLYSILSPAPALVFGACVFLF